MATAQTTAQRTPIENVDGNLQVLPRESRTYNHIERFYIDLFYFTNLEEPLWYKIAKSLKLKSSRRLKTAPIDLSKDLVCSLLMNLAVDNPHLGCSILSADQPFSEDKDNQIEFITYSDSHEDLRQFIDTFENNLGIVAQKNKTEVPQITHCFDMVM